MPYYFSYIDMACAFAATAMWLERPSLGPWPLLVALAPWAVRWWIGGRPSIGTAFDWPMLVFIFTMAVSVWAAYDREAAMAKFWLLVGAALLFYAFANWQVNGGRRAYHEQAWLLSGLGALTAAYFMLSNDWESFPSKIPAITSIGTGLQALLPNLGGERIHPNVVGGVLATLAPFAGAATVMTLHGQSLWRKLAATALLCLTLAGLFLTVTRGAWLALAAAFALAAWWPLSGLITRRKRRRRNLFFLLPATTILVAMLTLSVWPAAAEGLLRNIPSSETVGNRVDLYANSLNLLSDYPVIGAGLGGFMMLYSSYALLAHVGFITHSHNLYFDVVIEQGVVALIALSWMWLLMFEAVWRSLSVSIRSRRRRQAQDREAERDSSRVEIGEMPLRYWRVMLGAGAMSLVVILAQGLIDDPIYGSRAVVIFFVPLSFGVPLLRVAAPASRHWQRRTLVVAASVVLILGIVWWRPLLSRLTSNLAAVEQSRRELSVYEWPAWPVQDVVRRETDLSGAIAGYERALQIDQGNASANRRLGQIELSLGEYEQALAHLQRAYELAPWDNATRQLLGEAYITTGDVDTGMAYWRTADNSVSQLDLRRFWYEYMGEDPPLSYMRQTGGASMDVQ